MSDNKITGNITIDEDTLTELQYQVGTYFNHAIGYHEGELGVRARMGWEYYYGNLPEPVTRGSSKWVDRSVWESVNGTLQELVSVFTSGEDAVKFAPMHSKDADAAIAATKMVNKVLLRDNPGFNVLHDAFKECLITRNSFIKRYWRVEKKVFTEEFDGLTKDELDVYLAGIKGDIIEFSSEIKDMSEDEDGDSIIETHAEEQEENEFEQIEDEPQAQAIPEDMTSADDLQDEPEPEPVEETEEDSEISDIAPGVLAEPKEDSEEEEEQDEEDQLFCGVVTYEVTTEGVCVEYVPFEEVIIEPTARSLHDANYIGHRVRKSKDELIIMGFDADVIDELNPASSDIEAGVIANSRVNNLNPLNVSDVLSVGDEKADKLWLHENYIKTSLISGRLEILQVFTLNGQILEVNRVNEFPFETMTPFPIPGSVWGESVFDITKDVQDLSTTLIRGMIDNIMNANFRRYEAIKGQYDRESLLNNRPGAVVEVLSQGAVTPFPYHQLPQGIDNLLAYINSKKEERTGVSKVGQGLDPNVFKNDNSTATVNMVMSAAQNRLRMVARNIAQRGMMSLMLSIYNLIRENGKTPINVETANGNVTLDPRKLPHRTQMIVAVAVGDGERRERAAGLQSLMMSMTQIPALQQFLQPNNAYYLASQLFETMGIFDVENYLTPIDKLPPPQPDPIQELTIAQLQETVKQIGVTTQKILSDVNNEDRKSEFEQQKAADEMSLKMNESRSKVDKDADEMELRRMELELKREELAIQREMVELKKQEMLVEAQLEARQTRPVSLGR